MPSRRISSRPDARPPYSPPSVDPEPTYVPVTVYRAAVRIPGEHHLKNRKALSPCTHAHGTPALATACAAKIMRNLGAT